MINISLPNGDVKQFDKPNTNGLEIAQSISDGLCRNTLAAEVNGSVWDAHRDFSVDSSVKLLTWDDDEGKSVFWHTSAHLLAYALEELYPEVKLGTGPAIENGFYYDVDFGEHSFTDSELQKVEVKMLDLARKQYPNIRRSISKKDAEKYFRKRCNEYKLELIEGLNDGEITLYDMGDFTDLCAGPHLPDTKAIKAVKLTAIGGAYWRADENNKMLTRIYGISFPKKSLLEDYLKALEGSKSRDHRKLGGELDLFYFDETVGMGLPLWAPKGEALRQNMINYLRKTQMLAGYEHVSSPHIGKKELYITSGHYAKYGEDSFQPIHTPAEGEEFFLKPMNCPHHCKIFSARPKSYRDLPVKYAEFGTVYRYEQSGELHGLTRVRGFTQDDAHIYCRPDQLKEEFLKVVDLVKEVYERFGFSEFQTQISLRDPDHPDKYLGTEEMWQMAEQAIVDATNGRGMKTTTKTGEAAFYGPKLDFMVRDALGRKWQIGTIQVDYMMPENFDLTFIGQDGQKHRPVMIHRALFGSMERFIALLIENTGGNFPVWLSPEPIVVLPVSDKFLPYAQSVANQLIAALSMPVPVDSRGEKLGKKIRDAEMMKTPYMLIVGEKEMVHNQVTVRKHKEGEKGSASLSEFTALFKRELSE